MDRDRDVLGELALAFPSRLRAGVSTAAQLLRGASLDPIGVVTALVDNEPVSIPYRIYFEVPEERELVALSPSIRLVVDCLFSRHHDGHVRQRHGTRVASSTDPAAAPFVLQLLAEYVIEVADGIAEHIPRTAESRTMYSEFCAANGSFVSLARARAVSYWNCYYRTRFPQRRNYLPLALLDELCGGQTEPTRTAEQA